MLLLGGRQLNLSESHMCMEHVYFCLTKWITSEMPRQDESPGEGFHVQMGML